MEGVFEGGLEGFKSQHDPCYCMLVVRLRSPLFFSLLLSVARARAPPFSSR